MSSFVEGSGSKITQKLLGRTTSVWSKEIIVTSKVDFANSLLDFIHRSPSPFHVVANIKQVLYSEGYTELKVTEMWHLTQGERYFVTKNDSAVVAFEVGYGDVVEEGFRLIAAHTDSPTFRIKPSPEMTVEDTYLKLNTEVYGSPILNTWMDRPLSMAGRVSLEGDDPLHPETRLVSIGRPILIIPNQSLHMNRKVNEGIKLNTQEDMLPLLAGISEDFEKDDFLAELLAETLGVDTGEIIDFDLFLHEYERGIIVGLNEEFISSTKIDNLAMVHAGLHALIDTDPSQATKVLVCYDDEEIGSRTKQGAASPMLRGLLERVAVALGKDGEGFHRTIQNSFLVSADMGHGVHPNAPDKHDPTNRPVINGGPMIKIAAKKNFVTDSHSSTVFETICRAADVPVQKFVSRSDSKGGSTIGPHTATQLDMRSVDVGNPALAMHSIRELSGVADHSYITKSFQAFYAT